MLVCYVTWIKHGLRPFPWERSVWQKYGPSKDQSERSNFPQDHLAILQKSLFIIVEAKSRIEVMPSAAVLRKVRQCSTQQAAAKEYSEVIC